MKADSGSDIPRRNVTTPPLSAMLLRVLLKTAGQTRAARTVEIFGWVDLCLGVLILTAPVFVASLLNLPTLSLQAANYVRLVGLLVSGLGMLYVVSGRLNARGFVFASLLDRPLVPVIMALLWFLDILPGPLALAFSISDFSGFLWTLYAWRTDARLGEDLSRPAAGIVPALFGFTSGVIRNSRTFHPDGRVFSGTVRSLQPADPVLSRAAGQLAGSALMRIGMGVMKTGMPKWLTKLVPDAPSIATRFFTPSTPDEIRVQRHPGEDLDLLCTAGGERLWKLLLNLSTGGWNYGLHRFDYFRNVYTADVPYRIEIEDGGLDVWIRLVPSPADIPAGVPPADDADREASLTRGVAGHAAIRIEAQRTGDARAPFVPIAEIRFEEELHLDQEALHFDPVAGRGFAPHGFLTELRRSVYPASVHSRAPSKPERDRRESDSPGTRLARYFSQGPSTPLEGGHSMMDIPYESDSAAPLTHGWLRIACLALLAVVVIFGLYLAIRFTRDRPVDYTDDVLHFKHGSTGGERTMGIPYWFWVALPEVFPEYLPDQKSGRGYKSFGMIYEKGEDPRYALPDGVSMRNVRGIDVV